MVFKILDTVMGHEIGDRENTAKDYEQFNRRIHDQVDI